MICPYCDKKHDRRKWCSDHCKFENYKRQKRLANGERHKNSIKMCQHCNEEFAPRRHINERFCSNNCKIEFYKEVRKQETDLIRSQTTKTCPVCDKDFTPKKSMRQKYCSRRCRELFSKKIYKALQTCLKYTGEKKLDHAHKLLGYTARQLREHIQSHPNWPKVKSGDWHLDHIFPIIAFVGRGIKDTL